MAEDRVHVVGPYGETGTVDASEVDRAKAMGARVATPEEAARARLDAEYEQASTLSKVGGALVGVGAKNPTLEAWSEGGKSGLTAGLYQGIVRQAVDAIAPGSGAGDKYEKHVEDLRTGHEGTYQAGEVAGIAGGVAVGAASGAGAGVGLARALPVNAAATVGAPVEAAVQAGARAVGLAGRGALGRAATSAASLGARAAVESAIYDATQSLSEDMLHDREVSGEKLFAAAGHGALSGLTFGGALGGAGSLAASGARAAYGGARTAVSKGLAGFAERVEGLTARAGVEVGAEGEILRRAERVVEETSSKVRTAARTAVDEVSTLSRAAEAEEFAGRAASRAATVVEEAAGAARAAEEGAGTAGARKAAGNTAGAPGEALPPGPAAGSPHGPIPAVAEAQGAGVQDQIRRKGYEWIWDHIGSTAKQNRDMARRGLTKAELGETAVRYGVLEPEKGLVRGAVRGSDVEDMLERTELALETRAGPRIGELTKEAGNVRVTHAELEATVGKVVEEYRGLTGHEALTRQLEGLKESLYSKIGLNPAEGVMDASVEALLKQRRAIDAMVMNGQETVGVATAREVKDRFRNTVERVVMDKLDEAARAAGNPTLRQELRAAKRDYAHLSYIRGALVDSSHLYAGAAKGERQLVTNVLQGAWQGAVGGGVLGGGLVGGALGAAGGAAAAYGRTVLKDKASALGGFLLLRASSLESVAAAARHADEQIGRAAKGVFRAGAAGEARAVRARGAGQSGAAESSGRRASRREARSEVSGRRASSREEASQSRRERRAESRTEEAKAKRTSHVRETQARAKAVIKFVADVQSNPRTFYRQVQETAAALSESVGPRTAQQYTMAAIRALNFIVGHIPVKERRDPLDPRSVPPLTYEEADRLVRAAAYAASPPAVWSDFERGRVTPEGIAAAKAFMGDSYAEFQRRLYQHVTDHLADGRRLTATQRLRVDRLLEFPGGADLRPESVRMLQENHGPPPEGGEAAPSPRQGGGRPVNLDTRHAGSDAVEARKSA